VKRTVSILLAVVLLVVIAHTTILAALGNFLVKTDPLVKSDVIVVLAGDGFGNRVLKAGELVKAGYAPYAMVSGPDGSYGNYECDLAIPFAVRNGYPESYFVHFEHHARSTEEEAQAIVAKLRELGVKKVLLLTSTYHTRRAGKIFHRAAPDLDIHVASAPDKFFKPDSWWHEREARKTFLLEWMKTVAEW
jgi:uncharacterized SAM-binding protein YcdF (DUF218 family)